MSARLAAASSAIWLAACTSLSGLEGKSSYACKAPDGVTCESVSGTYANAVQNNLPSQRLRSSPSSTSPTVAAITKVDSSTAAADPLPATTPLRSAPRILRLWFKPWEDADHDLYDQGYVYVQIDAGRWQIEHMQRQIRDAYAPVRPPRKAVADGTEAVAKKTRNAASAAPIPSPDAPLQAHQVVPVARPTQSESTD